MVMMPAASVPSLSSWWQAGRKNRRQMPLEILLLLLPALKEEANGVSEPVRHTYRQNKAAVALGAGLG